MENAAPHRNRRPGTDDAVGAEHAEVHVRDVHAAALAPAIARGPAEEFREHAVEFAALGDQVTVATVGAGDPVVVGKVGHDAGGYRLLANVQVQRAGNLAGFPHSAGFGLEHAYAHHAPVDIAQDIVAGAARPALRAGSGRSPHPAGTTLAL